jgi:hypothetical protein
MASLNVRRSSLPGLITIVLLPARWHLTIDPQERYRTVASRKVSGLGVFAALGSGRGSFYLTRHTFIAWALSEGANLKGLAEYCGTSVQTIEQSCGRYIRKDCLAPLIEARPLGKAGIGEKTGPPWALWEKGPNSRENFGGGGGN